ncbi:hypothetical protein AB0K52_15245 [Glycomyces sp. NPDC049804]|uniref:hypothetical protein n=1 Tax=Glycomyces sp. NPDC049804 TaxID=3154363 RepID=UPI003447E036
MNDQDPDDDPRHDDLEARATHATIRSAKYGKWALVLTFFGILYMLAIDFGILSFRADEDGETSVVFNPKPFSAVGDFASDKWGDVTNWWDERERKQEEEERREEQEAKEARQERIERYGEFRAGRGFWGLLGLFLLAVFIAFAAGLFAASRWGLLWLSLGCYVLPGLAFIAIFWPSLGGPGVTLSAFLWFFPFGVAGVAMFTEDLDLAEKESNPH